MGEDFTGCVNIRVDNNDIDEYQIVQDKRPDNTGRLSSGVSDQAAALRLPIPIRPIRPEPNSHMAAGTGTGLRLAEQSPVPLILTLPGVMQAELKSLALMLVSMPFGSRATLIVMLLESGNVKLLPSPYCPRKLPMFS